MKRMLKWTVRGLGGLVLVVCVVAIAGMLLPVDHHATLTRVVEGTPEAIWGVITDVDGFPRWRSDVKAVHHLDDRDGLPVWVEEGAGGPMTLRVTERSQARRLVVRIADERAPFGGSWTYELEPAPGGTRVRITEDGEIYNPVFRFVARFVLGYEGTIRAYLDSLEGRMASAA